MKKRICILLVLALCLTAAAFAEGAEISIAGMAAANDFNMLRSLCSIGVSTVRYNADGTMRSNSFVSVADGFYSYEYNSNEYIFVDDDNGVYEYSRENGPTLYAFMLQSDYEAFRNRQESVSWIPSTFASLQSADFFTENGVLYMEYLTANENELASLADFGEVSALHYVCEADPETKIINYITVYAVTPEAEYPMMEVGYMYGVAFQVDQSLLDVVFGGDTRDISFVANAGTEDALAVTYSVTKGCGISFVSESLSLYADPECTTPYEDDGDRTADRIIYVG